MRLFELARQLRRRIVVGLPVERERKVVRDVVVSRIHEGLFWQFVELPRERVVEFLRMPAAAAIAGTGVEQRIAAKERGRVRFGQQADVAHGVSGGVEGKQFDCLPNSDDIAGAQADINAVDPSPSVLVRQQLRSGGRYDRSIAAGMVAVLVGVEDLRDVPTAIFRARETFLEVERIDGERLARLRAGDQVVEIAQGVARPDLLNDHVVSPISVRPGEADTLHQNDRHASKPRMRSRHAVIH